MRDDRDGASVSGYGVSRESGRVPARLKFIDLSTTSPPGGTLAVA
jgi:hypothetical protein